MMQYGGKLFHKPSHRFVTQERGFPFCSIAFKLESYTVGQFMFSSLCLHIWHISVHIDLVYGDRDNLILRSLIKLNK